MATGKNKKVKPTFTQRIARFALLKPVIWAANKFSSAPQPQRVQEALTALFEIAGSNKKQDKVCIIENMQQPVIIFSDQHKGARDQKDDFGFAEENYLAALAYYNERNFLFINMGDSEELWENTIFAVMRRNKNVFEAEKKFVNENPALNRHIKITGNHDLFWREGITAQSFLKKMFGLALPVYEAVLLKVAVNGEPLNIFCTHGHQGDAQSDGNKFSKWFVSKVWGPLQSFLQINSNMPSCNDQLKTQHNAIMYEWSSQQKNVLLITGHTHQPVFKSLTHLERLLLQLEEAEAVNDAAAINKINAEIPRRKREYGHVNKSYKSMRPSYFNTGCCCFADGTITGIEIEDGEIRLVKWSYADGKPTRIKAEHELLAAIAQNVK